LKIFWLVDVVGEGDDGVARAVRVRASVRSVDIVVVAWRR
jgi:hypothetical protein